MVSQEKLLTVSAFEAFADAHDDQRFELIDGRMLEKMPTEEHAIIAANIVTELTLYARKHGGRAAVEPRHRMPDDDHNARLPDVAYTAEANLLPVVRTGSIPQMPDLAVEIQSPSQGPKLMADKAAYYLTNGCRMVWLVYTSKKLVEIITHDDRQLLDTNETINGADVLPDFSMSVALVFDKV